MRGSLRSSVRDMRERAAYEGGAALARLGFADVARAATTLGPDGPLRLWRDDGPVDAGADAVVRALGDSANPDLALAGLAARRGRRAAGRAARRAAFGRPPAHPADRGARLLHGARRPPGTPPARVAGCWAVPRSGPAGRPRTACATRLLAAVGAGDGETPTARATGRTCWTRCARRTGSALLDLAARDVTGALPWTTSRPSWPTSPAATLAAGLAVALAGARRGPPSRAGWR